ncbi:MAG: HAMP domain-containing histidine kinase [Actinomycetota bacterium]|nr:HAMP domain-containing histidine kinase [Actinomycetota bacterium]
MTRRTADFEVVHDLRQPLATIAALVEAADLAPGVPPETRRCLEQIRGQVAELSTLCQRLLRPRGEPRRLAIDALAGAVAGSAQVAYGRTIEVSAVPAIVVGDEVDLRRALWNLLENACRASVRGPVHVVVTTRNDEVRVAVADSGPGFGECAPGCASLGLPIVEGVAERHGGRLEVGLSDLGGATVALVLPVDQADPSAPWGGRAGAGVESAPPEGDPCRAS